MVAFSYFSARNGEQFKGKCVLKVLPDRETRVILEIDEQGEVLSRRHFHFLVDRVLHASNDGRLNNVSPLPLRDVSVIAFDTTFPLGSSDHAETTTYSARGSFILAENLLRQFIPEFSIANNTIETIASL